MSGTGNEFYGVAAQVLPVLFVVLSVEFEGGYIPDSLTEVHGADELDLSGPQLSPEAKRVRIEVVTEAVYTTVMLAIFCLGEVLALVAYEAKIDTIASRVGVWVVLGCGAAACVFPLLSEQYRRVYDRTRPGGRSRPAQSPLVAENRGHIAGGHRHGRLDCDRGPHTLVVIAIPVREGQLRASVASLEDRRPS